MLSAAARMQITISNIIVNLLDIENRNKMSISDYCNPTYSKVAYFLHKKQQESAHKSYKNQVRHRVCHSDP